MNNILHESAPDPIFVRSKGCYILIIKTLININLL